MQTFITILILLALIAGIVIWVRRASSKPVDPDRDQDTAWNDTVHEDKNRSSDDR